MYELAKAAHIIAVVVFAAGMLSAPLIYPLVASDAAARKRLHNLFRFSTGPASLLILGFGAWIMIDGGWFRDSWMYIKLAIAFVVFGMHGYVSGNLRRAARDMESKPGKMFFHIPWIVLAMILAIVVLATVKAPV